MQFVSRSVITGFVNALAILIFIAQLPQLIGVTWQAYGMILTGLAIIYGLPRLTKAVPSPLVAILVLSAVSIFTGAPVNSVGDMGALPEGLPFLIWPDVPLTWETLRIILPYSLAMAAVGLLESLLTAQIVDDMTHTDSDKRRECGGQGSANIVAAFFGGMGGCAMIGQSVINVTSGGRGRLSTFTAGVFPSVHACGAGSAGRTDPHACSGCRDDHGFNRHVQLELHSQPKASPLAIISSDADHGDCGGLDP
jgi:SulP family sulfate permease